jgi:hypothetical protein
MEIREAHLSQDQKPKSRQALINLPAETQLMIFSYLHPVSSTCLGLTCKRFYTIHRKLYGTVRTSDLRFSVKVELQHLLETWMAPKWVWSWLQKRYVKSDELAESDRRYRTKSRRSLIRLTIHSWEPERMDDEDFLWRMPLD